VNESVAQQFSRAAESYERGAGIHRHVAARLMEMLPDPAVIGAGRILELGCGTGVLTSLLRQRFPAARLCAVDIAEGMAGYLRETHAADGRLWCVVADACSFAVLQPFDLVVSSSALHWATPIESVMANILQLLKPGGQLVAALMVEDTLRELHALRRMIAPDKIPQGRLPRTREVLDALHATGLKLERQTEEVVRAQYHSADDFLRTIHAQGLTGGAVSRASHPLTRSELKNLTQAYDLSYRELMGGVYASFEVLYFHAACPGPGILAGSGAYS
jgi:malonyl-CoA O-methyltransferase